MKVTYMELTDVQKIQARALYDLTEELERRASESSKHLPVNLCVFDVVSGKVATHGFFEPKIEEIFPGRGKEIGVRNLKAVGYGLAFDSFEGENQTFVLGSGGQNGKLRLHIVNMSVDYGCDLLLDVGIARELALGTIMETITNDLRRNGWRLSKQSFRSVSQKIVKVFELQ